MKTSSPTSPAPSADERRVNLIKDGGRRVMYCGNAYEDDVEPAGPAEPGQDAPATAGGSRRE